MTLAAYVARRVLLSIPVILGVATITFLLSWVATDGDLTQAHVTIHHSKAEIDALRHELGYDRPWYVQYVAYLNRLAHLDLGVSESQNNRPVAEVIALYFPATLELSLVAILFAVLLGIELGVLSAVLKDRPLDHVMRFVALSGVSLPIFWLGLVLKLLLASNVGWPVFPLGDRYSNALIAVPGEHASLTDGPTRFLLVDTAIARDWTAFRDVLWHLVLPGVTLGYASLGVIARMMRASMLDVLRQDYIRTARAKGLPERDVVHRHAKRNAMIPTTTMIGLTFGGLLGGAVITETVFQWEGLGYWSTRAIEDVDVQSVMAFTLLVSLVFVIANLVVDVLYAYFDPRVRLG